MGKIIVQYIIPALILLPFLWWAVSKWYLKVFPRSIKNQQAIDRATTKYESQLSKTSNKPSTKEEA